MRHGRPAAEGFDYEAVTPQITADMVLDLGRAVRTPRLFVDDAFVDVASYRRLEALGLVVFERGRPSQVAGTGRIVVTGPGLTLYDQVRHR